MVALHAISRTYSTVFGGLDGGLTDINQYRPTGNPGDRAGALPPACERWLRCINYPCIYLLIPAYVPFTRVSDRTPGGRRFVCSIRGIVGVSHARVPRLAPGLPGVGPVFRPLEFDRSPHVVAPCPPPVCAVGGGCQGRATQAHAGQGNQQLGLHRHLPPGECKARASVGYHTGGRSANSP